MLATKRLSRCASFKSAVLLSGAIAICVQDTAFAQENPASGGGEAVSATVFTDPRWEQTFISDELHPLVEMYLADLEAFLEESEVDGLSAAVERLLTDDPVAIDAVLAALAQSKDARVQGAVAEGIARAVVQRSAGGRDAASASVLARISVSSSADLLKSVVESAEQYVAEIATEGIQASFRYQIEPEIIPPSTEPPPVVGVGTDGGTGDVGVQAASPVTNVSGVSGVAGTNVSTDPTGILGDGRTAGGTDRDRCRPYRQQTDHGQFHRLRMAVSVQALGI